MSLGPVFFVEMLTVGRRTRYVITRVMYGLMLLVLMGFCYMTAFEYSWNQPLLQQQSEFAFAFFLAFSWLQLFGVLLLTPAMVAGTIAGEHERRTIDYLLTTSLTDVEISLGKFTARILAIAAQLAAGVPILAIAMTLGGIAPEKLFQSFAIALATLLSVGGLCLAISTRARTSREAIVRAYVILIAMLLVPPIMWTVMEVSDMRVGRDLIQILTELNPVHALGMMVFGGGSRIVGFSYYLAAHLGAAAMLAASSVYGLRRFYVKHAGQASPKLAEVLRIPSAKTTPAPGAPERMRWRSLFIAPYSMLWKEVVAGRGALRLGIMGRIAAVLLYLLALWGLVSVLAYYDASYSRPAEPAHIYGTAAVPMIAFLCLLLVAGRAAGSITSEREQDTWITLISTPLTGREIVWAKFWAAIYSVRYWYAIIVAAWLICVLVSPEFIWAVPILALVHFAVLALTAGISMLCSLNSTTSLRAMGLALTIIVLGLSIAPLFLSVLMRSEELTGFSIPVLLGSLHYMCWETTDGALGSHESDRAALMAVAAVLYGIAAVVCYAAAVVNFDAMIGRTTARPYERPTSGPAPMQPSTAQPEEPLDELIIIEPSAEPEPEQST